ncbi:HK97 gp10 family phage protein [Companilactobacillus metriopterae]|uniref:HK97 gp10 family phage protein n=1 Tax=Companilactobacillus metriopterae TaxID=1909267 RepID=UPI00100B4EF4|nr:HK97 gp10 family phage protein [Companilactobacillus metriopterae]
MAVDLTKEITQALEDYSTEVERDLEESKKKVAKEAVQELKSTSPKRNKGGGAYAKSWGTQKQGTAIIVRNKNHYQITHLLEYGHKKRNGGSVRAFPHISIAEEHAINNFEKTVESKLKK